jgi:hypothetical protein
MALRRLELILLDRCLPRKPRSGDHPRSQEGHPAGSMFLGATSCSRTSSRRPWRSVT